MSNGIFVIKNLGYAVVLVDHEGFYCPYIPLPYAPDDMVPLPDRGTYQVADQVEDVMAPQAWAWHGLGQWLTIAHHYAKNGLEVGATLYLKNNTVKVVLNRQVVGSGSCVRELTGCAYDLATDSQVDLGEFPCPLGTIHSHHNMSLTFSPVDDEQGAELPGVHLLVRSYPRPVLDLSFYSNRRYFFYDLGLVGLRSDDLKPRPLTTGLADWIRRNVTYARISFDLKSPKMGAFKNDYRRLF